MPAEPSPDILLQLQFTPLFAGLAPADIRTLVGGAEVIGVAADQPLFAAGDPASRFFVVLDGHVEVSLEEEGRRAVVEVARKGVVLGDTALFGDGLFPVSARTLSAATLLAVPAEPFLAQLDRRFDIVLHMLSTQSARLRLLVRRIAELKLKTTAQRLGSFLLSLTEAEDGAVRLRFPYDKKSVAEELGMKPESLSRALAKLARVGVTPLPDNQVAVADLESLRAFCAEEDPA